MQNPASRPAIATFYCLSGYTEAKHAGLGALTRLRIARDYPMASMASRSRYRVGEALELVERPIPEPGPGPGADQGGGLRHLPQRCADQQTACSPGSSIPGFQGMK